MAGLVAHLDLSLLDDDALPEVAAAAARVEAWAHAVTARVAAELAGRAAMNPRWPEGVRPAHPNIAADELAIRLNTGRRSAQALVEEGLAFHRALPMTGEALAEGRIDVARARTMVRRLQDVDAMTAAEVEVAVLPGASERTAAQLSRDVDRALLRIDPDGGVTRRERSRTDRHVSTPKPLPDGMAGIWAVLPAEGAARLDRALDASARALRARGDRRTIAQLCADGLLDATLVGPAWARSLHDHHHPETGPAAGATPPDTRERPAHSSPAHRPPRAEIRVTVPLSTLLGVDHAPGDLDGYGPIDAVTARALAAGGTWRRIVTDPLTDAVLDVGHTRYRPPAALAEHVIARDRTCARPGCTVSATAFDLDHTIPYATGGDTAAANLGPLCRRDHLLRTHAGHRIDQPAPGHFVRTTPTGIRTASTPGDDGHHHRLRPGTTTDTGDGRNPATDDDPIPF